MLDNDELYSSVLDRVDSITKFVKFDCFNTTWKIKKKQINYGQAQLTSILLNSNLQPKV